MIGQVCPAAGAQYHVLLLSLECVLKPIHATRKPHSAADGKIGGAIVTEASWLLH